MNNLKQLNSIILNKSIGVFQRLERAVQSAFKAKSTIVMFGLLGYASAANGQNELDDVSNAVTSRAATVFMACSAILLVVGIYYLVTGFRKIMASEQGGWNTVGGVAIVWIIWFGAVPKVYQAFKNQANSSSGEFSN